ncbi:MAG: ribonuclease [Chloroflexi bacterium]|jgi:ribonuclease HI|nr:ribonuclease [Chloroflexota bacterium]
MERERPHYILTFDGGSKGNPGLGYGSYEIRTCDDRHRVERREYGDNMTNNEAEYRTLIEGLNDIATTLRTAGKDPKTYRVKVMGDSQLVIKQLNGEYQVRHPMMRELYEAAKASAGQFGSVQFNWHGRANSVKALGH